MWVSDDGRAMTHPAASSVGSCLVITSLRNNNGATPQIEYRYKQPVL